MLDLEELRRSELGPHVERAIRDGAPDPGFFAVMGHNPDIAEAVYTFWMEVFTTGRIRADVKEIIRVKLSLLAQCHY